jgi:hypothetical protein
MAVSIHNANREGAKRFELVSIRQRARIDTAWLRTGFLQIFGISTTTQTTNILGTITHPNNTFTHKKGKEVPTSRLYELPPSQTSPRS